MNKIKLFRKKRFFTNLVETDVVCKNTMRQNLIDRGEEINLQNQEQIIDQLNLR